MFVTNLRRYPLFALFESNQIQGWIDLGQTLQFAIGESLFQEDTESAWIYLIIEGQVRVLRRTATGRDVTLALASNGDLVGDYALVPPHRNTATCRASEPTQVLALPRSAIELAIAQHESIRTRLKRWLRLHALVAHLRGKNPLGFLSAPSALLFHDHLQTQEFQASHTIQARGLADDRWHYIEEGRVKVVSLNQPLIKLGPGDCFGERALANWNEIPTVRADTAVRCMVLRRSDFEPAPTDPGQVSLQTAPVRVERSHAFRWVGQQEESDCGLASLAMVAKFNEWDLPLAELRKTVRLSGRGINLLELQRLAMAAGWRAQAVRLACAHLGDAALPAIAHYGNGHFVVLFDYRDGIATVGDPATGIERLARTEFERLWSGNLLLLTKW